jgi:putative hydrolase of the HAD superfamily
VDQLLEVAAKSGLDAIALTDHGYLWSEEEIGRLRRRMGSSGPLILRGQEVESDHGHLLVFGIDECLQTDPSTDAREIVERVRSSGGAVILAHPFRYGRHAGRSTRDLDSWFSLFDAVEILNANLTPDEMDRGLEIAKKLGLVAVGGSDAHAASMIGSYATLFTHPIRDEQDLADALRAGACKPNRRAAVGGDPRAPAPTGLLIHKQEFDLEECEAVLFDLYGTLVDIQTREGEWEFDRLARWLGFHGVKIGEGELQKVYRRKAEKAFYRKRQECTHPEIDVRDVFREICGSYGGHEATEDFVNETCRVFRAMTTQRLGLYPGTLPLLKHLEKGAYRLAIVSNAQRVFSEPELDFLGLRTYFDFILFSSDVGRQKPDFRTYERALEVLRVEPSRACFVGNDPYYDVYGAEKLGMTTVLVRSNILPADKRAGRDVRPDIEVVDGDLERLIPFFPGRKR